MALAIPSLLLLNILFFAYWILRKRYRNVLPSFLALLLGYQFLLSTFTYNSPSEKPIFSVLSYNVQVFNVYEHLNKNFESSKKIIRWANENSADVKCFQEFYNQKTSKIFNTLEKISQKNPFYHLEHIFTNSEGGTFSLAIFSRFPIVGKGHVEMREKSFNGAIYADIRIGKDTIRVYNAHLQSMNINENRLIAAQNLDKNLVDIAKRLKVGFVARAKQIEMLVAHIGKSPHKVILCGDLNDVPYSYTYFSLKKHLENAYENAARGFGFSYNGKLFFLRIDNQFYSKGLTVHNYETLQDVSFSDHFPIQASYSFTP